MRLWLIFIQADDHTWLEAAWDDDSTAENPVGWKAEVDRCRALAEKDGNEMRITSITARGVWELFDAPQLPDAEVGS